MSRLKIFGQLIELHCARWNRRKETGVMCEGVVRRFHTQAARALFQRGISPVFAPRINERVVAAVYGLLSRGQMRSCIGGFDPDLARLSLGTLAIGYALDQAEREGASKFNFLRGGERYKDHWGARDHYVYSREFVAD